MLDHEDPNTWTSEYVIAHRNECLAFLREINQTVIRYVQLGNYTAAITGLDRILNGLITMQNSHCGNYRSHLSSFSMIEGTLLTSFGSRGTPNAIKALKDARDFATNPKAKREIETALAALEKGMPLNLDSRDYNELVRMLRDMDRHLEESMSDVQLSTARSQRPVSSSFPARPQRAVNPGGPAAAPVGTDPAFEEWVEECGWDEEDLNWIYRKVRFRRNLYGVLLLLPLLGLLILPFWLRALNLTKFMRYRSFDVRPTFFAFVVCFLYGLPTLYIYPLIMMQIIKATNWGMGLGDRRALIPIVAMTILIGALIIPGIVQSYVGPIMIHGHRLELPDIGGALAALPEKAASIWRGSSSPEPEPALGVSETILEETLGDWVVQITIPEEWEGLYIVSADSDQIVFKHKATRYADGKLFFLMVEYGLPWEEDSGPPAWQLVAEKDGWDLIAMFPTDVQCDDEYTEEYYQMTQYIPEMLDSVEFERAA